MRVAIERSTPLRADPRTVWAHATSIEGINREMAPWLKMTAPRSLAGMTLDDATLGEPLFTSLVLFGGVVPVERMKITLTELEPGRRFVERSPMLAVRGWRHERIVDAHPAGSIVIDHVSFEPIAGAAIARAMIGAFFFHRHRRLGRFFNAAPRA